MLRLFIAVVTVAVASVAALAQQSAQSPPRQGGQGGANPEVNTPRPIDAVDSVFIEELTWMEVRDAIRGGKKTVIIATGGIEQNGPYLTTGKHNFVLRATTEAIARKLGDALIAPIVAFVPEGNIEPPSQHMRYPGTISLQESTFKALLTDIAWSMKQHGFEHIVLIGDSGGNQQGMKQVASELAAKWSGKPGVHFIQEFYDYAAATRFAETELGIKQTNEGIHDDYVITSIIMTVDPTQVRLKEREAKGKASINGVPITPAARTIEHGRKLVNFRAEQTVAAIRKAIASTSPQAISR
jgi:creatinine amidohydrolase/Fe(II)-dependent formamide hydrolase-like protein